MQPVQHIADDKVKNLIKGFEGLKLNAYQDTAGIWTIGYGTIRYANGVAVKKGDVISQQQAETEFETELLQKQYDLNRLLFGISATQNQFDALLSFVYNVGIGALRNSTLLKKMKANPNDVTIYRYNPTNKVDSCEFLRWVRSGGQVTSGLISRRCKEADLYAGK